MIRTLNIIAFICALAFTLSAIATHLLKTELNWVNHTLSQYALDEHGLSTPALPQSVIDTLPEIVPHNNPMDLTATIFAWADQYPKVIDSFIVAEEFDAVVLMMGAWERV